jgi:hypothetical protein
MNGNTFKAPWGKTLRWVSVLSGLLLAVAVPLLVKAAPENARGLTALPLLILAGAALFVIRGYTIDPNELLIRRLLWATRLPLAGLKSAEVMPQAMRGSLRLFGNGGLFSITGLYRNRALGRYRAFVTHLQNTVVLRFQKKTVVISPENPERFVAEISPFVNRDSKLP